MAISSSAFFMSPSLGKMPVNKMVGDLVRFMNEEPDYFYRLIIGTDSKSGKLQKAQTLEFVTAVVIHRLGKGGRYFWQKNKIDQIASLRDKIYTETLLSIQLAEKLVPQFTQKLNGQRYKVEIHIDVGNVGPTREMIKEVVGMVNGNGFTAKTKPDSYAASNVADKHT